MNATERTPLPKGWEWDGPKSAERRLDKARLDVLGQTAGGRWLWWAGMNGSCIRRGTAESAPLAAAAAEAAVKDWALGLVKELEHE